MRKLSLHDYCMQNSLEHILKEWHPTKNKDLKPYDVTKSSGKKIWWQCEKGHEWETRVADRTKLEANGCPYCKNRKLLVGYNDLATLYPEIAKEWHPTKNEDLKPTDFIAGSSMKVWWQCDKGHEWKASLSARTTIGVGKCPYCYNRRVIKGQNDLATLCPEIAKEWHPTKNEDLNPSDISKCSMKKIWWQCKKGHEWKSTVLNRTKDNSVGCPYCSKK